MVNMWTASLACTLLWVICTAGPVENNRRKSSAPLSADDLPYFTTLDPEKNYELKWNFNSSHILFQTKVKTTGYIGFGISKNGKMFPSDVIIAWVKDGKVHFKDRHATGHSMPAVDAHQDWHLISGSDDGTYTTITMVRKLDTCDSDDIAIEVGTTRVIYSYSPDDPVSDNQIPYHSNTRGTKSLLLLDPPGSENSDDTLPDDVTTIDFTHANYSVPSADTTYACRAFKLPAMKGKHHMIRYEPVIQKGHERLVHHMLLYYCTDVIEEDLLEKPYICYMRAPKVLRECTNVLLAWAIGGTTFNYPEHVGYSFGDVDDPIYFRLEVHYDNPQMKDDFVDSSGIRIYLTEQLRTYDAGIWEVGVNVDQYQIIPPHAESFLSQGFCVQECLEKALDDQDVYVFANFLHSHLIGKKLSTRHIRNGTELPPIMEDNNYDFDYQETRLLPEERTIKKGDILITDCYYDSSKRSGRTYGGKRTSQEMCLSYILYYPKVSLVRCRTRPLYNIEYQYDIFEMTSKMDFTKKSVRDQFDGMIRNSSYYICGMDNDVSFGTVTISPIKHPYKPRDRCQKN